MYKNNFLFIGSTVSNFQVYHNEYDRLNIIPWDSSEQDIKWTVPHQKSRNESGSSSQEALENRTQHLRINESCGSTTTLNVTSWNHRLLRCPRVAQQGNRRFLDLDKFRVVGNPAMNLDQLIRRRRDPSACSITIIRKFHTTELITSSKCRIVELGTFLN